MADLTYVATWRGFVYVAFVVDAYAQRMVDWRVSDPLHTELALDALDQALYDRAVGDQDALVHHSDWFKHRRLLEGIGYVPPAELEEAYQAGANPLTVCLRSR